MDFGEFLNAVVPYIILALAVFILYRPLKEPIHALWELIKKPFSYAADKKEDVKELFKSNKKEIEFQ